MSLTSNWTLVVLFALALGAVVATVVLWTRVRGPGWVRWPTRFSLIVACQLTACLVLGALVNNYGQFYTSWSELLGKGPGVSLPQAKPGAYDKRLAEVLRHEKLRGRSIIVPIYVRIAGHNQVEQAMVYLPAAYFSRGNEATRFPVVELIAGYPGGPRSWTGPLSIQHILDGEIAQNRASPFIAVMPVHNYVPRRRDGECVNAAHGEQVETTLTVNVRQEMEHDFRVATDRNGWAIMGYSTGGFCALNIAMRHPDLFAAGASLSGNVEPYVDRSTGDLFGNSEALRLANDPLWRAKHLPGAPVSLLLAASRQDVSAWRGVLALGAAVRAPTRAYTFVLPHGGHNMGVWRAMVPVALDWLSRMVDPPLADPSLASGVGPVAAHGGPSMPGPPPLAHHRRARPPVAQPPSARSHRSRLRAGPRSNTP
jgi:enterochelin esterase-like enzyme